MNLCHLKNCVPNSTISSLTVQLPRHVSPHKARTAACGNFQDLELILSPMWCSVIPRLVMRAHFVEIESSPLQCEDARLVIFTATAVLGQGSPVVLVVWHVRPPSPWPGEVLLCDQ